MKMTRWMTLLLAFISFASKGMAEIESNLHKDNQNYYQEAGDVGHYKPVKRPPQENGRHGAVIASKAGFQSGITTALILGGLVAATLVTVAALLISNSSHSH